MERRALNLEGALIAGKQGEIGDWVYEFLIAVGKNPEMAEGLRRQKRYWLGPMMMDLDRLSRCCGPELDREYQVDRVRFDQYVGRMVDSIRQGWEPPPLITNFDGGKLSVRDGNHRHEALIRSGHLRYWTIIWFNDEESYQVGKSVLAGETQ